ncbi:MAG: c-type cytochrome [Sediminibacterium magnilacihabitans]|jgi:mono/diheme cytochrome c family protein|nr:c-type cytochrome [Sediminibacterium magnilacihabitans]PQV61141.1 quinol:cytochrome c oxidoreductase pentaheme cytochrome subunit [Sediminibacterium magnilacihabitans]
MISLSRIAKTSFLSAVLLMGLSLVNPASAQDGKTVFNTNCASCHAVNKKLTGPALAGVEDRWSDRKKIHAWVHNPAGFAQTDAYAANLMKEYSPTVMTGFPNLSEKEIDAVLDYIKTVPAAGAAGAANPAADAKTSEGDNSLLFGVLTLILAVVALILLQVNSNLKKLADKHEGHDTAEPIPFWKNKSYIAMLTVILFVIGGYFVSKGAMALGRSKDYQPEQPIFYSHKVHAGINQINCQYCHIGVYQGKQATIPSVNICMNCHKAINEYKGEKIFNEAGDEVNGTAEIQKLYKYAGYESGKPWDETKAKPIEWVRIHNLPDHVYFNHSQHVKAGQVACQTCHGEITKMSEVKQFADLSMGWCINCHRETQVQFKDNGFYSIYEKYHQDLKSGKIDSAKGITVEKIGGTECQKCHY